jgi:hypothetical protein
MISPTKEMFSFGHMSARAAIELAPADMLSVRISKHPDGRQLNY